MAANGRRRKLSTRRRRILLALVGTVAVATVATAVLVWRPGDEAYRPGEEVEGLTSQLERELPSGATRPLFRDVTEEAGIDFRHFGGQRSSQLPEDMGSGVAWGDVDDDGLPDLLLVNIAGPLTASPEERARSAATVRLYRNLGGGHFRDATEEAGVGLRGTALGAAFGDVDDDGDLDLVITTYGPLHLFRNDGSGRFEDATVAWGLGGRDGFWTGATFWDYDRDGRLDLYICNYVRYREDPALRQTVERQYQSVVPASLNPSSFEPAPNLLFHNVGGRFEEVATSLGLDNSGGRSLSAAAVDLDDDGWPELYVANDISDNALFVNLGDGTFEEQSHRAMVADYRGAMGLAAGDWDNDSDIDLFVSHWVAQENAFYVNMSGDPGRPADEPLMFTDFADMTGLGHSSIPFVGWATSFFDYDLDGRLDLMVVNGHTIPMPDDPQRLQPMRSMLYWHGGADEGFFDVGEADDELAREVVARGAALADYDRDGDLDLVINVHGGEARLLRNDTEAAGRSITLRLRAGERNRFAVGARIRLVAGGITQTRELGAQSSYLSQNAVGEETFGLGRVDKIDSIEVRWPDGQRETAGPFATGGMVTWRQGAPPASTWEGE